jgi:mono/diheme cytochrome c family protein
MLWNQALSLDQERLMRIPVSVFVVTVVVSLTTDATATDLHHFWDQTCADCHGHSADFSRRFLTVEDGKLTGRHHKNDLFTFLSNHHLPPDLVVPVHDMLLAQASTAPRFRDRCGSCHETAAALARDSLAIQDGVLYGKEAGRPVAEFLKRHARLQPGEIPFFVDLLTRVEREVHGNP